MKKIAKARQAVGVLINRNSMARHRCLETMRYLENGQVKVKIGGPIRGQIFTKPSRAAAVRAVAKHYDAALIRALRSHGWRYHRAWMGESARRIFAKYRGKTPTKRKQT